MARFVFYVLCALINVYMQVNGVQTSNLDNWIDQIIYGDRPASVHESQPQPLVELSHTQVCKKAVTQISQDIEYSKRDDVLVNLVVNVCFPGVNQESLVQLLGMLSKLKKLKEELSTSNTPTESVIGDDAKREEDLTITIPTEGEEHLTTTVLPTNAKPTEAIETTTNMPTEPFGTTETDQPRPIPWVEVSHTQICKETITQISKDIQYSKRNDVFVYFAVNICFPGVNQESLLQLLAIISELRPVASVPALTPTTQSLGDKIPWDAGLLPETGPGQEDLPGIGGFGPEDEVPDLIGGLPAETGPGQEGVDDTAGGHAADETDLPDWTGNGDWWDGLQPDTDIIEQEDDEEDSNNLDSPVLRELLRKLLDDN